MAQTPESARPRPFVERSGTLIETDEDLRQALLSGLNAPLPAPAAGPIGSSTLPERPVAPLLTPGPGPTAAAVPSQATAPSPPALSSARGASPYRPTVRPPLAVLTVYDDGKLDGEVIRIRDQRFVIGRTEGDLKIPFDGRISSRHVEITLQVVAGVPRWLLTDLQSTHGMFVRVSRAALADKAEFLVGNGRYRLDVPELDAAATVDLPASAVERERTCPWVDGPGRFRPPALTELLGREIGNRTLLVKPEYWIGTDPACAICRSGDPFCEPRHVRLFHGPKRAGTWYAEHNKTPNGLWLRMSQITVNSMVQFQIGEQWFRLRVG
jgi:hypothetical protein